jgi:RNA 2',3'-cyclic 3'-phosphodiesterase
MKRIFIAVKVEPGETLLKMISSFKSVLNGENIKWTNADNIHITLVFLGDTEEEQIRIISNILKESCEGFGKFELMIRGSGVFKSINDPRVIWAGIEPSEKFKNLNELIKSGLKTAGIMLEERPFKPHLTLGRIKRLKQAINIKELTARYSDVEIQRIAVTEIILFESILLQTGPVYKKIAGFMI